MANDIKSLDLKETLSLEDIQHLFSATAEFTAEAYDDKGTIKLTLKALKKVEMKGNEFVHEYEDLDTLVYKPSLQTLIRDIMRLGYNQHAFVDSKK